MKAPDDALLEAMREVDALTPEAPPIAPACGATCAGITRNGDTIEFSAEFMARLRRGEVFDLKTGEWEPHRPTPIF